MSFISVVEYCPIIHLLRHVWIVYSLGLLKIKLLQFVYKPFFLDWLVIMYV